MRKGFFSFFLAGMLAGTGVAEAADISLSQVVLRGLDKITGRLSTMTVNVGEKAEFGALDIYVRVCMTHPPEETPENAAFLQVVEKKPKGQLKLFSGWMFSSSPALSAMEHPVYDVWVLKCQGEPFNPPSSEPLILENPLEPETVQPRLKISLDDRNAETLLSETSEPSSDEENPSASDDIASDGEAVQIFVREERGDAGERHSEGTFETDVSAEAEDKRKTESVTSTDEIEVIEEPVEGEVRILRPLPEYEEEAEPETEGKVPANDPISVNEGFYEPEKGVVNAQDASSLDGASAEGDSVQAEQPVSYGFDELPAGYSFREYDHPSPVPPASSVGDEDVSNGDGTEERLVDF